MTAQLKIHIVIVAYKRAEHFSRVLQNVCNQTNLPIEVILDAPPSIEIEHEQELIKKTISEHRRNNIQIYTAKSHLGVRAAVTLAVERGLHKADAVIVLEDDCVPLEGFFKFVVNNLEYYEDRKDVKSICGYLPPLCDEHQDYILSNRFIPWGWATWKDRWNPSMQKIDPIPSSLPKDLARIADELSELEIQYDIWSWRWAIEHYRTNTKVLYPPKTLVHNIGFDGSGSHCKITDVFARSSSGTALQRGYQHSAKNMDCADSIEEFMELYSEQATSFVSDTCSSKLEKDKRR